MKKITVEIKSNASNEKIFSTLHKVILMEGHVKMNSYKRTSLNGLEFVIKGIGKMVWIGIEDMAILERR